MKDKVLKILSEIATRKLCTMDEHMAFYNDKAKEDYRFLSEIEELIKSLQEEPVSEKKCMFTKNSYTDEDRKVLCENCKEKCAYNIAGVISTNAQFKKEPVSKDLKQAIDTYLATYFGGEKEKQDWPFLKKMAIHFANWQKQQMMANAVETTFNVSLPCGVYDKLKAKGCKDGDKLLIVIKEDRI